MGHQRGVRGAAEIESAGPDPDARAARRQRALRKRGDPPPSRRRAPGKRAPAARRLGAGAGDPRARVHRGQLLRRHQRHRFPRALVQGCRRGDAGAHPRRHARAAAPVLGNVCRSLSGAAILGRRGDRRARSSRRRRVEMVGRPAAPAKGAAGVPRNAVAHRSASPRSRPCSRSTGRPADFLHRTHSP